MTTKEKSRSKAPALSCDTNMKLVMGEISYKAY